MARQTLEELIKTAGVTPQIFYGLLANPEYRAYQIPKKNGGFRNIVAPQYALANAQSCLAKYLQHMYAYHRLSCVHGFVQSIRNHQYGVLSNASPHVGKPFVLNMDISNFFESISAKQVNETLRSWPFYFGDQEAKAVALLCTYQKKLPVGAPSSPVLSNMVFSKIDVALMQLVEKINNMISKDDVAVTYTRYADDLTFSGSRNLVLQFKKQIVQIINNAGFEVNVKKTRGQNTYGPQWVTGIKVNEKLNISRYYIRNVRAVLHQMRTKPTAEVVSRYLQLPVSISIDEMHVQKMLNSVQSKIGWIGCVRGNTDNLYLRLKQQYSEARTLMTVGGF
jgi:RNA-directed DNA polymerase